MWIFLPFGFYSIVDKPPTHTKNMYVFARGTCTGEFDHYSAKDFLCVRSRDKKSLLNLIEVINKYPFIVAHTEIINNQGSDYQYRMWVLRSTMSAVLSAYTQDINYDNFKNQADYEYKTVFGRVWSVLWDLVKPNKKDNRQMQLFDGQEYYLEEEIDIFSDDVSDADRDEFWDNWGK